MAEFNQDLINALSIPGNAKQSYLPFVLQPGNLINAPQNESSALKDNPLAKPQLFSFKGHNIGGADAKSWSDVGFIKGNRAVVSVCPSSFYSVLFQKFRKNDISFRTLYGRENKPDGKLDGKHTAYRTLLDYMPCVQIREYTPDVRVDQFFNFCVMMFGIGKKLGSGTLDALVNGFKSGWDNGQQMEMGNVINSFLSGVATGSVATIMQLAGNIKDFINFIIQDQNGLIDKLGTNYAPKWGKDLSLYRSTFTKRRAVLDVPFALYYLLQSQVTTNVYELPCSPDNLFDLTGQNGWKGAGKFDPGNDYLSKVIGKIPGLGKMMNSLISHVRINYMSSWNAPEGADGPCPTLTVKFSLFNDNVSAAIANFIFVNTIAPNNMWMQYGLLQQSPSAYDVKISGQARLFMCGANVKVQNKGVLRVPSRHFVKTLAKYVNKNVIDPTKFDFSYVNGNDLIRIPDVYEVSIEFKSMFPMNVNNYLYQYEKNNTLVSRAEKEPEAANSDAYYGGVLQSVYNALNDNEAVKEIMKEPPKPSSPPPKVGKEKEKDGKKPAAK